MANIRGFRITFAIGMVLVSSLFMVFSNVQAEGFGSNPDNYYCATYSGIDGVLDETTFKCKYTDQSGATFERNAIVKPPRLAILQVWFVRILYVLWGISGVVFTFIAIGIGIRYMLSFGNPQALADVIKAFQKWVIGLVLIFLSYPILSTLFGLLPLNQGACYANIEMPAFQFFFPTACVNEESITAP